MSGQIPDGEERGRSRLPIEEGFPIERINEIAEKESRAKQWYRPVYTMHKWWARRPGCLFRAISLYSLLDEDTDPSDVEIYEPGENQTLGANGFSKEDLIQAIGETSIEDPEPLWDFYPKDVRIKDKKVLDPFMGGGTSLVEASRFGAETVGCDLNPVAWFVSKKELEAGQTDPDELQEAFEQVKADVADEIKQYYRTPCPNGDHEADVMYNFWVKELDCVSCGHTVPLFKDYRVAKGRYENDDRYNVLCPDCGAVTLVDDWQSESSCTECSHEWVPKEGNVSRGGYYNCPECGQKESITDGIEEQGKPDTRLYAVEYYCDTCDSSGKNKSKYKGYKKAEVADKNLFAETKKHWQTRTDLHDYVPDESIPEGAITAASEVSGNDVFQHGLETWSDMFTDRQLLSLGLLMKSFDEISDQNVKEYLLISLSSSLRYSNFGVGYHHGRNHIHDLFKTNSFSPPTKPIEGNIWGAKYGLGTFVSMFGNVKDAVEYSNSPTERYVLSGDTQKTLGFAQQIGENSEVYQGDMRTIENEDEYDLILTDPPYYDNIIYSEISD